MPLLNRGLRVAAGDTQILLNNRVFENASGTAFVTIKPDAPPKSTGTQDIQVALLDPGVNGSAAAGYLRISVRYLDVGGANNAFSFVIEPLGSAANSPIVTAPINYTDESTLGLTWDATTGTVFYAVANADKVLVAPTQATGINAFTGGVTPVLSGLALDRKSTRLNSSH